MLDRRSRSTLPTEKLRKAAQRMKAEDPARSNASIARELGVAQNTVWGYLNPEALREKRRRDNARRARIKRQWEAANDRRPCSTCGGPMGIGAHRHGATRCQQCRERDEEQTRLAIIELRRAGKSNREIADQLGITMAAVANAASRLRKEGVDMPRSPYMENRREAMKRAA